MSNLISAKWVRTRTEHECFGCRREFPKGTDLYRLTGTEFRSIYSYYLCPTCNEYIDRYYKSGDEFGEGGIRDGDTETWEELRLEMERV